MLKLKNIHLINEILVVINYVFNFKNIKGGYV